MTPLSFDYPISVLILYTDLDGTTVDCAQDLRDALKANGHLVNMFVVTSRNWKKALRQSGDVVINLIEDPGWKLWGKVFSAMEDIGRIQFGIDHRSFQYSMSKARMKRRLTDVGLPTPQFRVLSKGKTTRGMQYPLILKPSGEHASEGISQDSVVIDDEEFTARYEFLKEKYKGDVVAEEFIEGREFHITVMGNAKHIMVLPYCEIVFGGEFADNWTVFTYDAKWKNNSWEFWDSQVVCPVEDLDAKVEKSIDRLLKRAFRVLGCRDVARFDIRLDQKNRPYIIDMNLLPDLTKSDDVECWTSAQALGWTYEEFIETLVAICYKRAHGRLPDRVRQRQFMLMGPR